MLTSGSLSLGHMQIQFVLVSPAAPLLAACSRISSKRSSASTQWYNSHCTEHDYNYNTCTKGAHVYVPSHISRLTRSVEYEQDLHRNMSVTFPSALSPQEAIQIL